VDRKNLVGENPEVVEKLTALMKRYIAEGRSTPGAKQPAEPKVKWPETSCTNPSKPVKQILLTLTDLAAFKDLIGEDTNGEITLVLSANLNSTQTQIASVFNTNSQIKPTLLVTGQGWTGSDGIPPAVPVGLNAQVQSGNIALTWAENVEEELAGYILYRSEIPGIFGAPLTGTLTTNAHLDTTAQPGVFYHYAVSAIGATGDQSALSPPVSISISNDSNDNGILDHWETDYFGQLVDANADANADGLTNLMEFAFGTNPLGATPALAYTHGGAVITPGRPIAVNFGVGQGVDFRAIFSRRKDFATYGHIFTVQFSADLNHWVTSSETPTVVSGDETANPGPIEAISVPYPISISTPEGFRKPSFFRVGVSRQSSP
jgi:hypothetical protein